MGPAAAPAPAPSADAVCSGSPRAFEEAQLRLQLLMQQAPSSVPSQTAEVQVTDARWGPGGRFLPERTEASSTPPLELTGGRALPPQSGHNYVSLAEISAENRQLQPTEIDPSSPSTGRTLRLQESTERRAESATTVSYDKPAWSAGAQGASSESGSGRVQAQESSASMEQA